MLQLIFGKRSQRAREAIGTHRQRTKSRRSSACGQRQSVGLGNRCSIP